jgi:uncharacterized protein (DUF2062 family)
MANKFIKRYLPDREKVENNRYLKWLGPSLFHPNVWHINRRSIAIGLAIGVFMGLLIPLAQIPISAFLAVLLRANLPIAITSTLISNPFTFAPLYYLAYRIGSFILGEKKDPAITPDSLSIQAEDLGEGLVQWTEKVSELGGPLILGLLILATIGAVIAYFGVMLLWRLQVQLRLRKKRRREPS